MSIYVKQQSWKCEWCGSEQDWHYGRMPRWCSNVCKYRARDEGWRLLDYKERILRPGPSLRRGKKSA